jgi:uncharacterized protein
MRPGGISLVGLVALVALLVLSATSVNAASFDCSRASVRAEFLVCGNPELSALDDRMAAAYAAARREAIDPSAVVADQRAWLIRRNNCGSAACVAREYQARLASIGDTSAGYEPQAPRHMDSLEVELQSDAGTLTVPVLINNAITLAFTVDSGATDVAIPADVVLTLIRTGTITDDDFMGNRTYTMADGSTVPSTIFRIRSLKVGNRVLHDVTASIAPVKGTLLLGQSFLGRFRSWSINNQRGVLILE